MEDENKEINSLKFELKSMEEKEEKYLQIIGEVKKYLEKNISEIEIVSQRINLPFSDFDSKSFLEKL